MKPVAIIGYSGHAYVVCDLLRLIKAEIAGYCDLSEKEQNPFKLSYLGSESDPDTISLIRPMDIFVGIGENALRRKVQLFLSGKGCTFATLIHPGAIVSHSSEVSNGSLVAAGAIVNPLVTIGEGAIINTGSIVEHECRVGRYAHVAPGAVLAGNVQVGEGVFVGANAVVKQGIKIGAGALIGAGTVVIRDVSDGEVVVGNPQRKIR